MNASETHAGYLYVLTNPSIPGQVKVGRTERNPQDRRKELSAATGIPTPFELVHGQYFPDCHAAEKTLHERWAQEGHRVSAQREFFRLDVATAVAAIDALAREQAAVATPGQPDGAVVKELLKQGFRWFRGDASTLRNDQRALEHFEQAAAMGSAVGAYWAARTCERLSDTVRRKVDQREWQQRALVLHQAAIYKGHVKACARASWLFRAVDQHDEADALWMEFLHRLARGKLDDEAARWVVRWCINQTGHGRMLPDSKLWDAWGSELLVACPPDMPVDARRALRRKVWPFWKRAVVGAGPDVVPLVIGGALAVYQDVKVGVAVVVAGGVVSWWRRRSPAPERAIPNRAAARKRRR